MAPLARSLPPSSPSSNSFFHFWFGTITFDWNDESTRTAVWATLGWVVVWAVLSAYCYRRFAKQHTEEFSSRVVSTVHAVVSTAACLIALLMDREWVRAAPATFPAQLAMSVSLGYFLVDLVGIFCMSYFELIFVFHHAACIAGLGIATFGGCSGFELVACTFLCEVSNPVMHLRWIVHRMKGHDHTLFRLLNRATVMVFLAARVVIGPVLTVATVLDARNPGFVRLLAAALQIISCRYAWYIFQSEWLGKVWHI